MKREKHYKATGKLIEKLMLTMGNTQHSQLYCIHQAASPSCQHLFNAVGRMHELWNCATRKTFYYSSTRSDTLIHTRCTVHICEWDGLIFWVCGCVVIDVCHGDEDALIFWDKMSLNNIFHLLNAINTKSDIVALFIWCESQHPDISMHNNARSHVRVFR